MDAQARMAADIEAAIARRDGRKDGAETRFRCPNPNHADAHPSARWNPNKATWCCDVCGEGGGALDLAKRLGLELPVCKGLTLAELAAAKRLSADFLQSLGVGDSKHKGLPCVTIPYSRPSGEVASVRRRSSVTAKEGSYWRKGDKLIPYGLPKLDEAKAAGYCIVVEGESDCWTLWAASLPALGIPGAKTWKPEWAAFLSGIPTIYVWREPDAGGDTLAAKVAASIPDVRIIDAPANIKDPSALWLSLDADADAFRERMQGLIGSARPASELRAEALTAEARECFAKAQPLLEDLNLIDRVADAIRSGGYAGDVRPPLLAYLALTSRRLPRPLNLAFIALSAAGKNRAVDAATALMPGSAYHLEGAGSARALVYGDADFQHRVVIVGEADSIPEDGPAASAVRALATDNQMTYDVVERDEQTGKFTVRHIVKPGPTGLITTSTRPLGPQLDTRMLTVSIPDTPAQTRAVLATHAASVNGSRPAPDTTDLVALQRWLELAADNDVAIPFSHALAELVPADLVRMRRDFRQLLTLIQAVALLYQRQRERDRDGKIVATLADYAVARDVVLDVFTAVATGGISPAVRETVAKVGELYNGQTALTVKQIADALALDKSSTWRRVKTAVRLGHLQNLETRKGAPARVVPGDALPEDKPALPPVSDVYACLRLPETHATVQPPTPARIYPESEPTVAQGTATAMQPGMQPLDSTDPVADGCTPVATGIATAPGADFVSETAPSEGTVAGLQPDRGDKDTYMQSSLVRAALEMGATLVDDGGMRCHTCGGVEFYYRADGTGPVCARCHPGPAVLAN